MTNKISACIDLNTANKNELVKNLQISPRLAERIIALRPYQSVDQIKMVWGIAPEELQRILPLLIIDQQEIVPELKPEKIPNPSEITELQENIEQEPEPDTIPQSTLKQKEELILQSKAEEPASQDRKSVV